MAGSYGPRDAPVYDRWRRIQQRDLINVLRHLQNQLETMRDCVLCFRSTVQTLDIDDAALFQVKTSALKVTQAMDEMRVCFRNVDRKLRFVAYNRPQGTSDTYTVGSYGPTGVQYAYPLRTHQGYPTRSNIVYAPDQRVPMSQVWSTPSTAVYNGELTDSQAYSAERVQFQEVPASEEMTSAFEEIAPVSEEMTPALEDIAPAVDGIALPSDEMTPAVEEIAPAMEETAHAVDETASAVEEIGISNGTVEEVMESCYTTEPAGTLDQHPELLADGIPQSPRCSYDHVPDSTYQTQNLIPGEVSQPIYEHTPNPYDQSGDTFEYLPDETAVAESACDYVEDSPSYFKEQGSPEYLVEESLNVPPTGDAQESILPPSSKITADEVLFLTDRAEGLEFDHMIEISSPEPPLDEPSGIASPTSHQPLGTSTAETAQSSYEHEVETELGHFYAEDFAGPTAEGIASEPMVVTEGYPDFERDLVIDLSEGHIATEELSGEADALYADCGRVETDQLTVSAGASCSELPVQTSTYRSGRESPEGENGSLDGFHSPVLSEAKPLCAPKVPPEFCDIDGLTKSLEELWSLDETSHKSTGASRPIQCIPQFGKIPKRIDEFRMPPPLKYVPAIVSYCADDGFYMQLMEDEKAMLKVDSLIERGPQSAPLKFSEVQPGGFVLCMYALDNRFYRAQLLKAVGDDKFEVRFIDYGNTCVASVRDMRRIPKSAQNFGQCAVRSDFSAKLKENAEDLKTALELVSLQTYFLACFAQEYVDCDREPPLFILIDIQRVDGMSVLQVPPPTSLEPSNIKFLVRNLELGKLGTVKLDLVEDLERKEAIAEMLRIGPNLPCKGNRVKEGSLVAYKYQRARVTKCASSTQLSLELIDEFQNELTDVPLAECSFLPLAAVKVPPAASCIVRVADHQDMESLNELCQSGADIQMTVVGTSVLPQVEFSRVVNGSSEEAANTGI